MDVGLWGNTPSERGLKELEWILENSGEDALLKAIGQKASEDQEGVVQILSVAIKQRKETDDRVSLGMLDGNSFSLDAPEGLGEGLGLLKDWSNNENFGPDEPFTLPDLNFQGQWDPNFDFPANGLEEDQWGISSNEGILQQYFPPITPVNPLEQTHTARPSEIPSTSQIEESKRAKAAAHESAFRAVIKHLFTLTPVEKVEEFHAEILYRASREKDAAKLLTGCVRYLKVYHDEHGRFVKQVRTELTDAIEKSGTLEAKRVLESILGKLFPEQMQESK